MLLEGLAMSARTKPSIPATHSLSSSLSANSCHNMAATQQKMMLAGNFSLEIPKLDVDEMAKFHH